MHVPTIQADLGISFSEARELAKANNDSQSRETSNAPLPPNLNSEVQFPSTYFKPTKQKQPKNRKPSSKRLRPATQPNKSTDQTSSYNEWFPPQQQTRNHINTPTHETELSLPPLSPHASNIQQENPSIDNSNHPFTQSQMSQHQHSYNQHYQNASPTQRNNQPQTNHNAVNNDNFLKLLYPIFKIG